LGHLEVFMQSSWQSRWKDYYEILQVSQKAEPEVILACYRKLAAKYHPDLQGTGDVERMKLINEAKEVLSDADARRRYDAEYERRRPKAAPDMSDEINQAKARERKAQADAAKARREAEAAAKKAQQERAELEEALRRAEQRQQPPAESPPAADPPAGASGAGWLGLLADVAKAALAAKANAAPPAAASTSLQGSWRGSDGISYLIRQDRNQIYVQGVNLFGIAVMEGRGTLSGGRLQLQYRQLDGSWGTAVGEASPNGQQIMIRAANMITGLTANVMLYR
jgi:curved DNA-binding protein CbpA